MDHPPEDLLTQYATGVAVDVGDHVDRCDQCARRVETVRQLLHDSLGDEAAGNIEAAVQVRERERERARKAISALSGLEDQRLRDVLLDSPELRTEGGVLELLEWLPGVRWARPQRALVAAASVMELIAKLNDGSPMLTRSLVSAVRELSSVHRALGQYDDALNRLKEAESIAEELPISELDLARVWYERGRIHLELGDCEEARRWAQLAVGGFRSFNDQRRINRAMYMIAASYYNEGSMTAAAESFDTLLGALHDDGDEITVACVKSALGHIFVRVGKVSDAPALFDEAISIFRGRGMSVDVLRARWGKARVAMACARYDQAVDQLRRLTEQFSDLELLEEASLVRLDLYECLLILGRVEEAESEVRESLSVLSGRFSRREQQRALAYLREVSDLRRPQPESVRVVTDFLDLSRSNPRLAFSPTAEPA